MASASIRALQPVLLAALFVFAADAAASDGGAANDGRSVYVEACAMCHANGVAGAPRFGLRSEWESRLYGGRDRLLSSVLKGRGAMPPKGGNASVKDAEAVAGLDYMLSNLR